MGSILSLLSMGFGCFGFLPLLLSGAALIDAFRVRADWYWFMIILGFPVVGSIAYFVVVRSPLLSGRNVSMMSPTAARRLQARRRLRELQIQLSHWRGPAVLAEAGSQPLATGFGSRWERRPLWSFSPCSWAMPGSRCPMASGTIPGGCRSRRRSTAGCGSSISATPGTMATSRDWTFPSLTSTATSRHPLEPRAGTVGRRLPARARERPGRPAHGTPPVRRPHQPRRLAFSPPSEALVFGLPEFHRTDWLIARAALDQGTAPW